jgi:transposase
MQGKEASEQETSVKSNVGIDVSKHWLDIHVLPSNERLRVCNNCQGIRQLKRWITRFDLALVVVEATGKWHRDVQRSLAASAIRVALVDPFRVRMFAKADGILAKTDRLDAKVLASFAAVMTPPVRPPAPQALAELAELMAARMSAVKIQTMLKNERSAATFKLVQRHLDRRIERRKRARSVLSADARADPSRRRACTSLRHPDLNPELRFCHRGGSDRLSRRARQHQRENKRYAGGPCSHRRPIWHTRGCARHLRRTGAGAPGALPGCPFGDTVQRRHACLLPTIASQRKTPEGRSHRRSPQTRRPRQHVN